jgi:hypothetical protein
MSVSRSVNEDSTRVGTRRVIGNGNRIFDQRRFHPIHSKDISGTSNNIVKNIDIDRRRNNSKLHRLLVRSPRSPKCDGGDNNSITSNGSKTIVTSISDRSLPPPIPPPITTPKKQTRYSMVKTMMDHYSYSPSPTSVATTVTSSSTTGSTTSKSKRTHSATSFSTFFSHSDNEDIGFDSIHEEGIGWRVDSDDEGSQTTMSIRAPLISKLLRNEMERRDGRNDEWKSAEYNMSSYMCKFACFWSIGACMWILFFALSMSINSESHHEDSEYGKEREIQWMKLDRIRYASSIFWTVGGDDYPGKDDPRINSYHRIVTCIFMTGSLGFMGLTLGQWGDAIIRTYDAAVFKNGEDAKNNLHAQKCYAIERGNQSYHRRHQKPVSYYQERRRFYRPQHRTVTEGNDSYYGSLPLVPSKHKRTQWHDLSPLKFPDSSDDETDCGNRIKDDNDDGNYFVLFPRIHWLLMQSLVLTTLSAICVAAIRYCEQNQHPLRTMGGTDKYETPIGSEVSFDGKGEDGWDFVSTLYYAVSTASTSGMKNAIEPVSAHGKFFALLFVPLSVITSLHWMVYIAQNRILKSQQQVHFKLKKRMMEGREGTILEEEHHRFNANSSSREIVFVADGQRNLSGQNDVANNEDDDDDNDNDDGDDDYVVRTPVSSICRKAGSVSSLEKFYELELQRMGLVDIETFRVLKRKYALQQRLKLKETDGR